MNTSPAPLSAVITDAIEGWLLSRKTGSLSPDLNVRTIREDAARHILTALASAVMAEVSPESKKEAS